MAIYNFIHKDRLAEKDEYFFKDDKIVVFDDDMYTLAHLLAEAGKFRSVTEGRKNGWGEDIPAGYSERKIGKDQVFILNKFPHWDDDAWWSDDNPRWGGEILLT